MSGTLPANEPECLEALSEHIDVVIASRPRDLGGFTVRRTLPSSQRRRVGPFVFFDHMGPASFAPGQGFDVRPHPHIGLATLTYLFDGEIVHRDSLGSEQCIRAGDVNWMLAGRGIAHSERASPEARRRGVSLHGIQSWVALPTDREEAEPRFDHHDMEAIPRLTRRGATIDLIAGTGFGASSPVGVLSPTLYAHVVLDADAELTIDDEHAERGVYVVEGEIGCGGRVFSDGNLVVMKPGRPFALRARNPARVMIIGGAKLDGERHIFWNFVSSSKERIERAKDDWRTRRFAPIPGDDEERIPLPD